MEYKEVIVVEGIHDLTRIKEAIPTANIIVTNGQEISDHTLNMIKEASLKTGIILFLDPDGPGEKIRRRLLEVVPNAKHAFITKQKCLSHNQKKVGVQHASKDDILETLEKLITPKETVSNVTFNTLFSLGIVGKNNSRDLRRFISESLNIGYPNAKTFLNRIKMFGIDKKTIEDLVLLYFSKNG